MACPTSCICFSLFQAIPTDALAPPASGDARYSWPGFKYGSGGGGGGDGGGGGGVCGVVVVIMWFFCSCCVAVWLCGCAAVQFV